MTAHTDEIEFAPDRPSLGEFLDSTLAELLDAVETFVRRYVVMSESQATAVTLWAAHTHVLEAFEQTPYLLITSPTKRSGKSRTFDCLELIVARPWKVIMPSEAVLFRKIEKTTPTLLLDEIDAIFSDRSGSTEPLRALLNAGNRAGTTIPRCVGQSLQLTDFNVYCAKALAGIAGNVPATVLDRSISVVLQRKAPGEGAEKFRRREAVLIAGPIWAALERWALDSETALSDARPVTPGELDDRAEESWEPLLAIAELAGDEWATRARNAAMVLSTGEAREEDEAGLRLLSDIHRVLKTEKIATTDLITLLCEDDEAGWSDWYGSPIKARALARLLKPFGIRSRTVRLDEATAKGYHRTDFEPVWKRYPPVSAPVSVTSDTLAQPSQKHLVRDPSHDGNVTDNQQAPKPHEHRVVTHVTDRTPQTGEKRLLHGDDNTVSSLYESAAEASKLPGAEWKQFAEGIWQAAEKLDELTGRLA